MNSVKKKLPIGIENFAKIQSEDFYYVDKTMLIKELLDNWAEVNLFTRPRRFGKTVIRTALKAQEFPEKFIFANNIWESSL